MTLNPSAIPGTNFDLDDWKLQLPVDANGQFIAPSDPVWNHSLPL